MRPCAMAGAQCPQAATVTLRIADIGDRSVCSEHHAWMESVGMSFRVLDPNAYKPMWMRGDLARDFTPATGS